MPSYEVKLPTNTGGLTLKSGHDIMYVEAADAADARAVAAGHFDGDSAAAWQNSATTVTEITVASDLSPVATSVGTTSTFKLDVTVVGADTNATFSASAAAADSYADVFAAMVVLLLAHGDFTGAAFGSNLLTVSSIGDDIGDHTLTATFSYGGVDVPSFLSTVTHEGIPGAVLTVASNASVVLPKVLGTARSR